MGSEEFVDHGALARARRWLSRFAAPESTRGKLIALLALLLLTGLCIVLNSAVGSAAFPVLAVLVPVVFSGLLLSPRPATMVIAAALVVVIAENLGVGNNLVHPGAYVILALVGG